MKKQTEIKCISNSKSLNRIERYKLFTVRFFFFNILDDLTESFKPESAQPFPSDAPLRWKYSFFFSETEQNIKTNTSWNSVPTLCVQRWAGWTTGKKSDAQSVFSLMTRFLPDCWRQKNATGNFVSAKKDSWSSDWGAMAQCLSALIPLFFKVSVQFLSCVF